MNRRTFATAFGAGLALASLRARAQIRESAEAKEAIAILGTGRMGSVLGTRWGTAGHRVIYGSRTPNDPRVRTLLSNSGSHASAARPKEAVTSAAVVVFALPWTSVKDLVPTLGDLSGKIIIDPMNERPRIVEGYPHPPDDPTSLAEQLQTWAPGAAVVKAFNTIDRRNLLDPARIRGPMSIPLAGADRAAKTRVASLVSELGLEPVDTGPLIAARYLEDMLRLSVGYLIYSKGKAFEFYLQPAAGGP
jgi:8-hydroxy-5-deazaflavin:NADPH oxidoreductase